MFIGASPVSTGGGVKTTTLAILGITAFTVTRGETEIRVGGRSIDKAIVLKAVSLTMLAMALIVIVTILIQIFEPYSYERIVFEVTSAFGTVGLSTGITPYLKIPSKLLLIFLMYIGRIGPLTFMLALAEKRRPSNIHLPEGKIYIG
jgi:trk system potassium uptake protein TrkH